MLHPKGRVSEVQRRQMTTIDSANVFNIAVDGSFDDCQDLVKAMFNDHAFRDAINMSAVNSINWARVMAQVVYYAAAAVALGAPDRRVGFSVPSGNFGNIFAGYVARQMGFDLAPLIVGANRNDILARFFKTGRMEISGVEPSLSPSMDIQVSSNLERLLFDLFDRDGKKLGEAMTAFRSTGKFAAPKESWSRVEGLFRAAALDDPGTLRVDGRTSPRDRRADRPPQRHRHPCRPGLPQRPRDPDRRARHRPPRQVPGCGGKGHRNPPSNCPSSSPICIERPERIAGLPKALKAVQDYVLSHRRNDRNG